MARFTFDLGAHREMGGFVSPGHDIWVEVSPGPAGFVETFVGRGNQVRVSKHQWESLLGGDLRDRSVARLLADSVANICYPTSLSKTQKVSLVKEIRAYIPELVRDVLGLTVDQIDEIVATEAERVRRLEAEAAAKPAPAETGYYPWEERGLGGHTF